MRYDYFVPSHFVNFTEKCTQIVKSGEIGIFFFPPKSDRIWRLDQMLQDYKTPYPAYKIRLLGEELEDWDDIEYLINREIGRKKVQDNIIFITNAELIIDKGKYSLIDSLVSFQRENRHYHFILLSEKDITYPEIAQHFYHTDIFSNIVYYPLYDFHDALAFINYLNEKWNLNIKSGIKEKIAEQCGSHTWLIKHVLRCFRDNPMSRIVNILESDQINFKLENIYLSFSNQERKVLQNIVAGKEISGELEKHSFNYLKKLRIVENEDIAIPLLTEYIRHNLDKINIDVSDNKILINGINIENQFSKKERNALRGLLSKKNLVIPREELARVIWPLNTESNYTDWAMDRIISRLRNKLVNIGLPKHSIKTLRKRGYMLTV